MFNISKKIYYISKNISEKYYFIPKTENQILLILDKIVDLNILDIDQVEIVKKIKKYKNKSLDFYIKKIFLVKSLNISFLNLTESKFHTDSKIIKPKYLKYKNDLLIGYYYNSSLEVISLILYYNKIIIKDSIILNNIIENSILSIKLNINEMDNSIQKYESVIFCENNNPQKPFINKKIVEKHFNDYKEKNINIDKSILTVFDMECYEVDLGNINIKEDVKKHIPYCFIIGKISIKDLNFIIEKNIDLGTVKDYLFNNIKENFNKRLSNIIKNSFYILYHDFNHCKNENEIFLKNLLYNYFDLVNQSIYTFNGKSYDLQILRNLFLSNIKPSFEYENNYFSFDSFIEVHTMIYEMKINIFDYNTFTKKINSLERDVKIKKITESELISKRLQYAKKSLITLKFRDVRTIISHGSLDSISKQLNVYKLGKFSEADNLIQDYILNNIEFNKHIKSKLLLIEKEDNKLYLKNSRNQKSELKFIIYYGYCYKNNIELSNEEIDLFLIYSIGDVISLLVILKYIYIFTNDVLNINLERSFTTGSLGSNFWKNILIKKEIELNNKYLVLKQRFKELKNNKNSNLKDINVLKNYIKTYKWKTTITIPQSKTIQSIFNSTKDGGIILCNKFHHNMKKFNFHNSFSQDFNKFIENIDMGSNIKNTNLKNELVKEKNNVLKTLTNQKQEDFLIQYDVNSLYPRAMDKYKYPIGEYKIKKVTLEETIKMLKEDISFVSINTKLRSPIENKKYNHLFLPKTIRDSRGIGVKRTYGYYDKKTVNITSEYLKNHLEQGFKIEEVDFVIYWENKDYVFKEFVDKLYNMRKKFDLEYGGKSPFGYLCKLILNSLYGKTLQGVYNETIKIVPTDSLLSKPYSTSNITEISELDLSLLPDIYKEMINDVIIKNNTVDMDNKIFIEDFKSFLNRNKIVLKEEEFQTLLKSYNIKENSSNRVTLSKRYEINSLYDYYIKVDLEKNIEFPSIYGSFILSYSKKIMFEYINIIINNSIDYYYTDTDSLYVNGKSYKYLKKHISENDLGKLSIDGLYLGGIFFGNKTKMLLEIDKSLYKNNIQEFIDNYKVGDIDIKDTKIEKTFKGFKDIDNKTMFNLLFILVILKQVENSYGNEEFSQLINEISKSNDEFSHSLQILWKKGIDIGVHTYISKKKPSTIGPKDSKLNINTNSWYN